MSIEGKRVEMYLLDNNAAERMRNKDNRPADAVCLITNKGQLLKEVLCVRKDVVLIPRELSARHDCVAPPS